MAGQASPGVTLTPNQNVSAPAGTGGDRWGANGGGIAPVGVGKLLAMTLSDGETASNYIPGLIALNPSLASAQISAQLPDANVTSGGSNQG